MVERFLVNFQMMRLDHDASGPLVRWSDFDTIARALQDVRNGIPRVLRDEGLLDRVDAALSENHIQTSDT